jgi:hypothetical protein
MTEYGKKNVYTTGDCNECESKNAKLEHGTCGPCMSKKIRTCEMRYECEGGCGSQLYHSGRCRDCERKRLQDLLKDPPTEHEPQFPHLTSFLAK